MAVEAVAGTALSLAATRPTRPLALGQLINLSTYWLGIQAIWAGLGGVILPRRMEEMFGLGPGAVALAVISAIAVVMPIVVQPTLGVISDYTTSRWGRRKPYICVGAVLDVVFLAGIAASQPYLAIVLFYVLLQFSSNLAQGPFQGYMPDLVPEPQVGRASGLMGVMIVAGQILGVAIATLGSILVPGGSAAERFFWPTIGLGVLELAAATVVLARVPEGPTGLDRGGRTWPQIGRLAWGKDILTQRSFVWLVCSRLCFLAGTGTVTSFALFYLEHALAFDETTALTLENIALIAVIVPTALAVIPAARLSDRIGRKRVIYAACAAGGIGLAGVALSPVFAVGVLALIPVGIGAGSFLAVDWALMTDIIPKRTAGRYMGISNLGTALAGPVALLTGAAVIYAVSRIDEGAAVRVAFLVGASFFGLAALLLRRVDPTPRD